jgi:signal transduction histidine kinase
MPSLSCIRALTLAMALTGFHAGWAQQKIIIPKAERLSMIQRLEKELSDLQKKPVSFERDTLIFRKLDTLHVQKTQLDHNNQSTVSTQMAMTDSLMQMANRHQWKEGQLFALHYLASVLRHTSKKDSAYALSLSIEKECEQQQLPYLQAWVLLDLGATLIYRNNPMASEINRGVFFVNKALAIGNAHSYWDVIHKANGYLAGAYMGKKQYQKALYYFERQVPLFRKHGPINLGYYNESTNTAYLGILSLYLDDVVAANRWFDRYNQLYRSGYGAYSDYIYHTVFLEYCNYYLQKQRYQEALLYAQKYANILPERPLDDHVSHYERLYTIYSKLGNYEKALENHVKMATLKDSLKEEALSVKFQEIESEYELEKKENQIASLQKQQFKEANAQQKAVITGLVLFLIVMIAIITLLLRSNRLRKDNAQYRLQLLQTQKDAASLLIQTQETERQRIAADLHDDLGGTLATLRRHLDDARRQLHDPRDHQLFDRLEPLIHKSAKDLRRISHNLMPPEFARLGLAGAIEQLVAAIPPYPTHFELVVGGQPWPLPHETQLNLYRIVSELVHNIIKHAQATRTTVELLYFPEHLTLLVEDNGKRVPTAKNTNKMEGIGVKNSRLRAEYMGATIRWEAEAGGTCVILELPYIKVPAHEPRTWSGLSL